jgi:hypothetical protein
MRQNKSREPGIVMEKKIVGIAILSLVAMYAFGIIARPTISPEFCATFVELIRLKGWGEVFADFLKFDDFWYRPFTFRLTNFLLFQLIDFQNIYAVKSVGVAIITLNAFVASTLARKIFQADFIEQSLIFVLILTHPLYLSIAYDGSGIADPIFNISINLFLICLLSLLEGFYPLIAPTVEGLSPPKTWQACHWSVSW